jgi:hypothetical protein
MKVGDKIKFSISHMTDTISFNVKVVRIDSDGYWVEFPPSVRNLPFPPADGKRYAKYPITRRNP